MLYNRFWFYRDLAALTVGGGFIRNPGRYLVLAPPGHGADVFTANPGDQFNAWDLSATVDFMPSQFFTWRLEYIHRQADTPYFVGPGGVTSPDGWSTTPVGTTGWKPDLVKTDDHIMLAILFPVSHVKRRPEVFWRPGFSPGFLRPERGTAQRAGGLSRHEIC